MIKALGAAFSDRYAIVRELGRGGMASVFLAQDLQLQRQVALKVLRPELAASLGNQRFLREIEIAARLSHPNILALHDSGEAAGKLYYAMPYVEGESLRQKLDRQGPLPVAEVITIVKAVARALTYAHRLGIIHRDIKPENILLAKNSAEGGTVHPLVADFGIARALDAAGGERLTETGLALGTPAYMSPEQAAATSRLDGRSDIYALGCVAYEMLAGQPPFTGPTAQAVLARHAVDPPPPLHTVRATLPPAVEVAVERALAKVPADRFPTADEFAQALTAEYVPAPPRSKKVLRRMAVGLATAAAVVATVTMLLRNSSAPAVQPSASTMAVLPLFAAGGDTALTRLGKDLAVTLSASLDGVGEINTADRLLVANATAERSSLSAADAAVLARRLGSSSFLRGTLVQAGDNVRVDLGLYSTNGVAPLAEGISVTAHRDSIRALTDSVTWRLLRQVWQRGTPPSPSLAAVTTGSLPALRAFLDGERELARNDWEAAGLAYRSAIAADSSFWLAYFQYALAEYWNSNPVEDKVLKTLREHREAFPEREQLLVKAFVTNLDSAGPNVGRYRDIIQRYPDYWPGWFLYGDMLYHRGAIDERAEATQAFRQVTLLNPSLAPGWDHLFQLRVGSDSGEASRAYARMVELGGGNANLYTRLLASVNNAGGIIPPHSDGVADSMAALLGSPAGSNVLQTGNMGVGLLRHGFPAAQIDVNNRVLQSPSSPSDVATALRATSAWAWATRGQWDSALVLLTAVAKEHPGVIGPMRYQDPPVGGPALAIESYAMAVFGAWLAATSADLADQRRRVAVAVLGTLPDEPSRQDARARLAWLDGLLGLTRGNRTAIQAARRDAIRSGYVQAELVDRSLAAFDHMLRADQARAGRELAELEDTCIKNPGCNQFTPPFAVQRVAAAEWLLATGQADEAARLLSRHVPSAWSDVRWTATYAVSGPAYLVRARAEEVRGEVQLARDDYQRFLRIYDQPMASQLHLINEAKAALVRLEGSP